MTTNYERAKDIIKEKIANNEESILSMKETATDIGKKMVSIWNEEIMNLVDDLRDIEAKEKSTTVKEMNKKLNQRFSDLKLSTFMDGEVLYVHSIGLETEEYASKNFRIAILPHELKFKKGYEIHPDLILLANDFRKDYFNLI